MNIKTVRTRLRDPETCLESEYRLIHEGLLDMLASWNPSPGEDVEMFLVDVLLNMRSSINVIARDLGLLGTIVSIEQENAAYFAADEPDVNSNDV